MKRGGLGGFRGRCVGMVQGEESIEKRAESPWSR